MSPQFYVVGGAVRDAILGVKPTDIDYLVVGATPEWMLANGYTQVGADFPVFLKNGEEYALARTERKTGAGYHGFEANSSPEITIEQDLSRRDLTVNSMAVELKYWPEFLKLCEKYRTSLEADFLDEYVINWTDHIFKKAIMMNGGAFKEDPVRVFRAVRMRHTLPEGEGCQFVADEWDYGARTWKAMEEMVASDDFKELTRERVAQEVVKTATKCTKFSQLAGFFADIFALGAMPNVVNLNYTPFELKEDCEREGGFQEKHALTYLTLCVPTEKQAGLVKQFRERRYSNEAMNFAGTVEAVRNTYGVDVEATFTGANLIACMEQCSLNDLHDVLEFLLDIGELTMETASLVGTAQFVYQSIGLKDLTDEQQTTLVGREIGQAIRAHKINLLDEHITHKAAWNELVKNG